MNMHLPYRDNLPGHRFQDTSIEAAKHIANECAPIQREVLSVLAEAGATGATTNEISARLRRDRGAVQPRTSELKLLGLIVDSKQRRKNASGVSAIVWTLPEFGPSKEGAAE